MTTKNTTTEKTLFQIGELVTERVNPGRKMIISRYQNGIYYCYLEGDRKQKSLTYLERDLKAVRDSL